MVITHKNIQKKTDGTFIIDFRGFPFHVTPDYPPTELYGSEYTHESISLYAAAHPEEVTEYIEPEPYRPTEAEITQSRIAELEAASHRILPYIQAGIDVDIYQQKLTDVMLEIEELKGNLDL